MTSTLTNICSIPVYAGYPTILGFFASCFCLLEGCVETGIRETYLNSYDSVHVLMKTQESQIMEAAIVIVCPEFSFNSYWLAKGPIRVF